MQLYYYVQRGEQQFGPYLSDALLDYISQGNIVLSDLVFLEDMQAWVALENSPLIQGLSENTTPAAENLETISSPEESSDSLPEAPKRPVEITPELNLEMIESPSEPVPELSQIIESAPASAPTATLTAGELAVHDLTFKNGVAQVEIEATLKGEVNVAVESQSSEALTIEVQSAPATTLILKTEDSIGVGQSASVMVSAIDPFGNIDETCQADLTIKYSGSAMGVGRIQLKNGVGNFTVTSEKATISSFVVVATGEWAGLRGADAAVEFSAGPAVSFQILGPAAIRAGEKSHVRILARDQFGNQTSRVDSEVRLAIQHFVS